MIGGQKPLWSFNADVQMMQNIQSNAQGLNAGSQKTYLDACLEFHA